MSETHTPGPWRLTRTQRFVTDAYGGPHVCEVDQGKKNWRANACLIAMTPEVVKALSDLLDEAEDVFVCMADATGIDRHNLPAPYIRARVVLKRALGEEG